MRITTEKISAQLPLPFGMGYAGSRIFGQAPEVSKILSDEELAGLPDFSLMGTDKEGILGEQVEDLQMMANFVKAAHKLHILQPMTLRS